MSDKNTQNEPDPASKASSELSELSEVPGFQFDHIAQQVPDIAEAVAWYLQLLPDAKVLFKDTSWAFVEVQGVRLAFVKKDQHPNHLAWRVSNALLETMAAKYQKPIATHRDKTRSFYLEAPGNQWIEIICMEDATWAKKLPDSNIR